MTKILIPKPRDPLQDEIDRRLATRKAKDERKPVAAPVVGTAALHDGAAFIRANPVSAAFEIERV